MGCYDGKCKNYKKFFTNFEEDITLEQSLIYLCVTPFLYFGILALLETQFVQKVRSKYMNQSLHEINADEQVQREKSNIYQKIQSLNGREYHVCFQTNLFCKEATIDKIIFRWIQLHQN